MTLREKFRKQAADELAAKDREKHERQVARLAQRLNLRERVAEMRAAQAKEREQQLREEAKQNRAALREELGEKVAAKLKPFAKYALIELDVKGQYIALSDLPELETAGVSAAMDQARRRLRHAGAPVGVPDRNSVSVSPIEAIRRGYTIVAVDPTGDECRELVRVGR